VKGQGGLSQRKNVERERTPQFSLGSERGVLYRAIKGESINKERGEEEGVRERAATGAKETKGKPPKGNSLGKSNSRFQLQSSAGMGVMTKKVQ